MRVYFDDVPNTATAQDFTDRWIATLDRSKSHTIRFETKFVPADDNDVVRVYIDKELKARGTTWENYDRLTAGNDVTPNDRLMWVRSERRCPRLQAGCAHPSGRRCRLRERVVEPVDQRGDGGPFRRAVRHRVLDVLGDARHRPRADRQRGALDAMRQPAGVPSG